MIQIDSKYGNIEIGRLENSTLSNFIFSKNTKTKFTLLVDENTKEKCLPHFLSLFPLLEKAEVIEIPSGEKNKNLLICEKIWEKWTSLNYQRKDVLINLGGGMLTDLGGLAASLYKRGIDFVNIPTTLLSMVDASVGGKTGVNFKGFKNQIGLFSHPILTVCDSTFLKTLEEKEIISGKAEMIKHGLIFSSTFFEELRENKQVIPSEKQIETAVRIKSEIVSRDFRETGERKKLNFGHTVGHAIEEFLFLKKKETPHGICVAWGMLVESYLSHRFGKLPKNELQIIENLIREQYFSIPILPIDFPSLIDFMRQDKKNEAALINFTFLNQIGQAEINRELGEKEVLWGLEQVFR